MKRSIMFLILVSLLLGACIPGQPLFVYPAITPASPAAVSRIAPPAAAAAATVTSATPAATAAPTVAPLPAITATQRVTATPGSTGTRAAPVRLWQAEDRLPVDPQVHEGVLTNGLTYIIRKNDQPGNRAELRLVINAGSVLEADDQQGLAHFLEHMLFNGTCRFPKQGIKDFLESNGMRFGADLNAYTSFDETAYILRIPMDDPKVLDTGLNVLVDWASCATLDPAEIDRERGVIVEEHRLRELNAQGRIRDQLIEGLLSGSQYAKRLPIGDMKIVEKASVETIRRFYTDWYRPDLMAVVAVGDFDLAHVEQLVREKFAAIPARKGAPARATYTIPDFGGTRYLVASDPENPDTFVQVYVKEPADAWGTVALYRKSLVRHLAFAADGRRSEGPCRDEAFRSKTCGRYRQSAGAASHRITARPARRLTGNASPTFLHPGPFAHPDGGRARAGTS
jgi:zinc protease